MLYQTSAFANYTNNWIQYNLLPQLDKQIVKVGSGSPTAHVSAMQKQGPYTFTVKSWLGIPPNQLYFLCTTSPLNRVIVLCIT